MKAFVSLLVFAASTAFAAAPESIKVETQFQAQRAHYKVTGTALLHKETEKKIEYRGVAKLQNDAIPEDMKTVDFNFIVKKKRDKFEGALAFSRGWYQYNFYYTLTTLVPPANTPFRAEFQMLMYDPGPPGSPTGSIWWPIANHATELTVSY